ncbi:DUF2381 family protein [Pyxidicoccus trucidator]|uniref:DUF2381 family protein n=1 Tax=Pyxidicoccus trucidator TaxID=2709662 RepID=UPI0013DD5E7A|nr:DUF2381 family protein [Pyxidicoccus trucidator]
MPAALPAVLLVPLLLAGPDPTGLKSAPCQMGVRHVELPALPLEAPVQVCISSGQPTLINFDGALAPGSVGLEGEGRFALVDAARSTLKLVPSEKMVPGERFRLTVRFDDTAAPASATLLLVVHAAQAEPLVNVYRQTRTAESFRQQLQAKEEEVRRCQEDNARLRAERPGPGGLAGLLALDLTGDTGVAAEDIGERITRHPSSALEWARVHSYRAATRVAVRLHLANPAGAAAWAAEGASLVLAGRQGVELKVLAVWQQAPIAGGGTDKVVVEAEAPVTEMRGPFILKLWEAGGTRPVTLGGVTFP